MARATVTPWRTHRDLLDVRRALYRLDTSSSSAHPSSQPTPASSPLDDPRHRAVQRVMAWKARGNLPHAVESTALLLDAILHHRQPGNTPFSIRAVYTAAFTRFVTGFCDIGRSKERLLEPSSMLEIARQIDLPAAFVELRHEATHGELPEMHRLVAAAEDALDWLWAAYWSRLEDGDGEERRKGWQVEARSRLKEFRSARREALRMRAPEEEFWKAARPCVEMLRSDAGRAEALVEVLLEDRLLVPSKRERGAPLDGAFLLWDRLLQALFLEQPRFLELLVAGMLAHLDGATAAHDGYAEALCLWLAHVAAPDGWPALTDEERSVLRTHVAMWCCAHPGCWSPFLGERMLAQGDAWFREAWAELLQASRVDALDEDAEMAEAVLGSAAAVVKEEPVRNWTRRAAAPVGPLGSS